MRKDLLTVTVISLTVGAVFGWFVGISKAASYASPQTAMMSSPAQTLSTNVIKFKMDMRKLWEEHIVWTRLFIVSAAVNGKDIDATTNRLLKNQEDIGNAIKPYYGEDAGNKLTALLKDHINLAAALVKAAKVNDQAALTQANDKWYANANDIADFLSSANPNWPNDQTRAMMKEHLDLTKQEAVGELTGKYDASVADYDQVENQILNMADMLSDGIAKQFPDKF